MKHITCSGMGLVLILGLSSLPAGAQNQATASGQNGSGGSSLGEYARQIRKDPGATSKPKVFDNDNLPRQDKLSVVGQVAAPPSDSGDAKAAQDSSTPSDAKAGADAKSSPEKAPLTSSVKPADEEKTREAAVKQWTDKLTAQKEQIELLGRELDVLQREYQIRAAAMYADAGNRMRNSGEWDKQDAQYKQQIADKQKAVEDAKTKLDDMQEDARKAGVPASARE